MAIKNDGTLWSCGNNYFGELGNNAPVNRNTFQLVNNDTDWKSVDLGDNTSFAVKTNGMAYSCGMNISGVLGNSTSANTPMLTSIGSGINFQTIVSCTSNSVALDVDGNFYAWGSNVPNGTIGNQVPVSINCPTLTNSKIYSSDLLFIYPNPVHDFVNIRAENLNISKVIIADMTGKIIFETNQLSGQIDTSKLQKGLYVVKIQSNGRKYENKLVKI